MSDYLSAAAAHAALRERRTTSERLTREAIERTQDAGGEGARALVRVYQDAAIASAAAADAALKTRDEVSVLHGLPVTIKDLFDVAGEVTLAGSKVRRDAAAAAQDSPVVRRLKAAGAVIVGKTNMTEFAYSGLGLNPHYGTPLNPCDRGQARIPGGSSSGAAVAVADGMAQASVGTDTGGSARIPAAFCGLTGYKPTAARIPTQGAFPLSPSLDSVGAIARTVDCCARLDAVLSGERWVPPTARGPADIALGVVTDYLVDGLEPAVSQAYERALEKLSAAGIRLVSVPFPELHELAAINREGGFPAVESHRALGDLLASRGDEFDPRVAARIHRGKAWTPDDYARLLCDRERFIGAARKRFEGFDALLCPTVPMVAPRLRDLETDEAFNRLNLLALRNPSVVNFLDGCAWSLPCQRPGDLPVGLSLFQLGHADRALLSVALAVERELRKEEAPR